MKKFNVTIDNNTDTHCFSFEAENIQSALDRLKVLNLQVTQITELNDNYKGTIRIPEEMYSTLYAVLRKSEHNGEDFQHGIKYTYMYNEHDVLFIWDKGSWNEAPSTAFDFIQKS